MTRSCMVANCENHCKREGSTGCFGGKSRIREWGRFESEGLEVLLCDLLC